MTRLMCLIQQVYKMNYSKTKDIIKQGNFLSENDLSFVFDNIEVIQNNWDKRQTWRTETEMRISVLNDIKHPTAASKYWQCIREQSSFYESLVALSFDYRRNRLDRQEIEVEIKDEVSLFNRSSSSVVAIKIERLKIDLEEKQFAQTNMEKQARERMREIKLWAKLMDELDDGSFDTEDVNTHQLISYACRFEREKAVIGDNASPSEKANLIGQFNTAIRHLEENGLITKKNSNDMQKK